MSCFGKRLFGYVPDPVDKIGIAAQVAIHAWAQFQYPRQERDSKINVCVPIVITIHIYCLRCCTPEAVIGRSIRKCILSSSEAKIGPHVAAGNRFKGIHVDTKVV